MFRHPTDRIPESINVLALGPTNSDFHSASFAYDPIIPEADETWTLNKGFRTQLADVVFILDDLVGECRRSARYHKDISRAAMPIITTVIDDDVARLLPLQELVAFPYWELIDLYGEMLLFQRLRQAERRKSMITDMRQNAENPAWQTVAFDPNSTAGFDTKRNWSPRQRRDSGLQCASYFKNSIPMLLAYAGFIGVETIHLFGADYDFPGASVHEADKPNAEYWAGLIMGFFGCNIRVSSRTTFMSTNQGRAAYGYGARQPVDTLTDVG